MISISNLTLAYKSHTVINQLSIQLESGHIHGLVGMNGSGKTTLLRSLHGLHQPAGGTLQFRDKPLSKRVISYLPTENYFYANITGREYLSLFRNSAFDADEWNNLFHLPLDHVIDSYSTGMKKKLAILGILKEDKPILILDEPFNGLDLESGRVLHSILSKLKKLEKTVLITSHILDSLMDLCDKIHYLESSTIQTSIDSDRFESFRNDLYGRMNRKTKDKIDSLM